MSKEFEVNVRKSDYNGRRGYVEDFERQEKQIASEGVETEAASLKKK